MNKLFKYLMVVSVVAISSQAWAGNVNVADARRAATNFIQQQARKGTFKAASGVNTADLTLAHAEASKVVAQANDYYAFNVKGGGWIIIAGEDRATPVLGYSDRGNLDFNRLPCTFEALLGSYKREIEYLQAYQGDDLVPAPKSISLNDKVTTVGPLVTSTWGQEMPYYLRCPLDNGEYCVVGCVATAMAQVMKYWQYPESCGALSSYYCYDLGSTVTGLRATTFDYSLMLDSYCHWDWDNSELVQDEYTNAQAMEAAKLSRYCGQAVQMGYSPEGSGAYTSDQRDAMVNDFGFRSSAQYIQKSGWGSSNYTTAQWEAKMKTELDAGRPILYAANDPSAGGHAFICDGYDKEGMFHFNFGWYGTCDGWYVSTALNMTHRDGDELHFNSGHHMVIGVQPPEGWEPPVHLLPGDINGDGKVDVTDVNIIVNIILGKDNESKYPGNANVDGQGGIDVGDVNMVVNILLGKS